MEVPAADEAAGVRWTATLDGDKIT